MLRDQPSFCRICAAACGIVVAVDGDRVERVRGDLDHPVSRGYTCSKGRGLPEWHHSPSRLDQPSVRGTITTWDQLLSDLAGGLGAVVDRAGADAVGLYLATGLAYDAAGQVAASRWLPAIGSRSFFTAVTVDNAPVLVAAELVTGQPMLNPVWDPDEPGLLVLVGTNPVVSHGYGTAFADPIRRIREYRRRGGEVWVLDPRRTETAAIGDEHVPIRPGADIAVLGAVASALLVRGADAHELATHCEPAAVDRLREALARFSTERAADAAGVDHSVIVRLVDAVRTHRGRVAVMCGTGVTMSRDGVVAEWLRWVLLIVSGSLDRDGGMRFNRGAINRLRAPKPKDARSSSSSAAPPAASRPELPRVLEQLSAVAIADEIEAGNLRALVVTGGNPITACPEPDRMRAALAMLDVLAVVDVHENELTALATHVLPATGQLERADLTLAELTAVRSGLQATGAVVAAVAQRKPVWWMLASIARRMGADLLGGADPDAMTDEMFLSGLLARAPLGAADVFAAGPHGIDVPHEYGWVRSELLPGGRWNIAPNEMLERLTMVKDPADEMVVVPRREMGWSNSVRYGGAGFEAVAQVNSADLPDGATTVTLRSAHGEVAVSATADDRIRPGVVSVTHGRAAQSPGRLTSSRVDVDPLTTMPRASGVPVTITAPAASDWSTMDTPQT